MHNYVLSEDYAGNNVSEAVAGDSRWIPCDNSTDRTSLTRPWTDPVLVVEVVVLSLVIVLTVLGNLLVILAVRHTSSLRTPTHLLIVNLAVADFLLGFTVLPLSAVKEIYEGKWIFGPELCLVWTTLDVLCCTASILSLCVISVDRYVGVSRPLSYSRIISKRRVYCLIATTWILSLAISIAPPLGWREELYPGECHVNKQLGYVIFSACGSFYFPALVILVLYSLVYRAASRHSRLLYSGSRVTRSDVTLRVHVGSSRPRASLHTITYSTDAVIKDAYSYSACPTPTMMVSASNPHTPNGTLDRKSMIQRGSDASRTLIPGMDGRVVKFQREKKAAKTLAIVVGGFLLCWFPFFIILPIDAACTSCQLSGLPFTLTFWLGYFNSCLNPFIYACSSRELRRAFTRLVCPLRRNTLRNSAASLTYTSTMSLRRA